jgi:hypothetical protein
MIINGDAMIAVMNGYGINWRLIYERRTVKGLEEGSQLRFRLGGKVKYFF